MFFKWFRGEKRLSDLEARLKELEDRKRATDLEWDEMYEKFRLLYVRLSKRVKRLDEGSVADGGTQPGEGEETTGDTHSSLSPRQQAAQRMILLRRQRVMGGG